MGIGIFLLCVLFMHEFFSMLLHLTLLVWYFSPISSQFFGTFLVLFPVKFFKPSMKFSYIYYIIILGTEDLTYSKLALILLESYLNSNFDFIITCAYLVLKGILKLVYDFILQLFSL